MLRAGRVNAAVRSGNEAVFRGTVQSVAGKNAWTGSRTRRHIFRTHRFTLREISYRYACVLDVCATWKTRHFDGGPRRRIPELKPPRVMLIHNPRRNRGSQVRIYKDHVLEFKARCFED